MAKIMFIRAYHGWNQISGMLIMYARSRISLANIAMNFTNLSEELLVNLVHHDM